MIKKIIFSAVILSMLAGSGCRQKNPGENPKPAETNVISKVEFINKAGLQNLIKNRNGKILLINVWATWCPPCVEEFPDLVRLSNSYEGNPFEIVGISVDEPEETDSKVIPFLNRHKVPFKVFIAKIDGMEDFINSLNSAWNGAIPASFFYNTAGEQHSFIIGARSYEQFSELLAKVK